MTENKIENRIENRIDNTGPLAGIRVVEMGQLIAGPFCGQLLGDMGADVIQVEPPGVGDQTRTAVTGAGHVEHVEVTLSDHPVGVGVEQVQPRGGAPVAEQPRLDVLGQQRGAQQRVVHQVDLADRQVVRGAPRRVEQVQLGRRQRRRGTGSGVGHGAPGGRGVGCEWWRDAERSARSATSVMDKTVPGRGEPR